MAINGPCGTALMVEQRIVRAENRSRRGKLLGLLLRQSDAEEREQDAEEMVTLAEINRSDRGEWVGTGVKGRKPYSSDGIS